MEGYDSLPPDLAGHIAAVYDRIRDRPPPSGTAADRAAAAETAEEAARFGWPPSMAWDDDRIDLPGAGPEPGWCPSPQVHARSADLVEDAEFVRETSGLRDATVAEVAARLGIGSDRLHQAYLRARRHAARAAVASRPDARDAGREAEAG
jgi:hypothetical protein